MQEINGALYLKANFLLYTLLFAILTVIVPFTTIYASLELHNSDSSVHVLNLICLLDL